MGLLGGPSLFLAIWVVLVFGVRRRRSVFFFSLAYFFLGTPRDCSFSFSDLGERLFGGHW